MSISRSFSGVFAGAVFLSIIGCGGNAPDCGISGLNVVPSSAMADHAATAPGNSQVFSASFQFKNSSGCVAITAALVNSNWTASDPSVHFSSTPTSMVTATCTAAVTNPVTIIATSADGQMLPGQASLTCK